MLLVFGYGICVMGSHEPKLASYDKQSFHCNLNSCGCFEPQPWFKASEPRLVVENDRAPLACYLADGKTTSKSRSAVLKLLREIWKEFSGISSRISELSKLYIL